ncbi:MAG: hypothetical protein GY865_17860 [candidate division Zixibacteria bacterium]|nr:hypothetical protein [candidate division Zixibacteria bacterium]
MKKDIPKITLFICFCLCISFVAKAEIEIPISQFSGILLLSDGGEFDTDDFDDDNSFEKINSEKSNKTKPKYSKAKAVALSLLLPGAGHYYVKHKGRGQVFLGAEVATWFAYFAFHSYGGWKEDDYKNYAVEHAGITNSGHDDRFYRNLIFYNSREEYNTSGRIINPGAPYYSNDAQSDWFWDNDENRMTYRAIRNASEVAYRKATFMLGVALVNRVIAGIDAFRLAQKESNRFKEDDFFSRNNIEFDIKADPFVDNPEYGIVVRHRF